MTLLAPSIRRRMTRFTCAVAATGVAIAVAPVAKAQEEPVFLEEIVVVAQKREQTLQSLPVAVSVVSKETLDEAQVLDVKDLQFLIPSLRVSTLQSSGNTTFLIRGFGNGANNVGVEPSVGVFIDGVYRSRTASSITDLPNLQRIEVIKGPQSTLFGKNASAGVINVVTAAPSLDDYSGSVSATFGDYSQLILKGDVNGPISDTFAWGASGYTNTRDGYFTNLGTGSEFNELNRQGLRGQLYWVPTDRLEARLIADYDEIDELCCGVASLAATDDSLLAIGYAGGDLIANQPFAYEQYYNFDARNEIDTGGVSLQLDWDLSDTLTLTSITAFRNLSRFDNSDSDFTSAALINEAGGNTTDYEVDTLTQELRLSGAFGRTDWLVGAFYFDEEVTQNRAILYDDGIRPFFDAITVLSALPAGASLEDKQAALAALGAGLVASPLTQIEGVLEAAGQLPPGSTGNVFFAPGQGNLEVSSLDNQSFSLFAQADIGLTDRMTLTLGLNYTEDEKDAAVNVTGTDAFSTVDLAGLGFAQAFTAITGLPPTPDNIAANPAAAQAAQQLAVTECSAAAPPPNCNQLLGLQQLQFLPQFVNFPNQVEAGTSKDDNTSWTVRLAYDLTDELNAYFSAGTGFKATSWNLTSDSRPFAADIPALQATGNPALFPPNLNAGTRFAGPEESQLIEVGLKGAYDRVAFNLAIFDQEIEGFQENVFQGTGFVLTNAGKQSSTGAEIDVLWAPTDNFEWSFGAMFLDPKYDEYLNAPGIGGPTDLSGTKVPGVSEFSANTWARYTFEIGSDISGFVRGEYYYESDVQIISNVPESIASREVGTINASVGLRWLNGFEAMLWGRNLNDDEYLQSAFPTTVQPAGNYSGYPNQPRTYGLTLSYFFD